MVKFTQTLHKIKVTFNTLLGSTSSYEKFTSWNVEELAYIKKRLKAIYLYQHN